MDWMGVARQAKEDVRPSVQSLSSSSTTTYADVPSPSPPQEQEQQQQQQQPLPAPSDSVAVVSPARLTRQVSSVSSQGKTLSPADEQEIFPEEALERMLELERRVQHLSSEVESQKAMFETSLQQHQQSIQAIETKNDTAALLNRIQALEIKAVDDTAMTDKIQALETKLATVTMDKRQELETVVDEAVMKGTQVLENELVTGMTKGIRTVVTRVETAMTDRLEALGTKVEETAMMDRRIQALERTVHDMNEMIKGMEGMVKELKKTVDRSSTDLPSRLQIMNDRIHFLEKHSINTMS